MMQSNKLIFYVPFLEGLRDRIINTVNMDDNFIYYGCVDEMPEIMGGRYYSEAKDSLIKPNRIMNIILEEHGSQFQFLANSTFPKLTNRFEKICDALNSNNGGIVVSKIGFAQKIKDKFPNLKISSSCIMSFYIPFKNIMNSSLFDTVCAPMFWHPNVDKMIEQVPASQRNRVYYIINTYCQWIEKCRLHYEAASESYYGNVTILHQKWPPWCTARLVAKVRVAQEPEIKLYGDKNFFLYIFQKLKDAGFIRFKLQGRSKVFPKDLNNDATLDRFLLDLEQYGLKFFRELLCAKSR
ncbi:MAG: hypothetical protein KAW47_08880 [Thermoplasmatales archaeon]|nr:hypothetical protein [Thermoplasmatales archaeon]